MKRAERAIRIIPVLLVFGFIPLIVTAKKYEIGLSGFDWASNSKTSVDLFLYWKGQALLLLAFIMFFFAIVSLRSRSRIASSWEKIKMPETACALCFLALAAVSAMCSRYRDFAMWGSYEQWEGLNVLAAYVVLLLYTYMVVGSEKAVRMIVYSILLGGFAVGLIGVFQFLRMDFFRSGVGQAVMNLLSPEKMNYTFNFSDGWVYTTLYNPNYVGSFVALILPLVVILAVIEWKKIPVFWTILAMVTVCLLIVTLFGSQSMTGCVGVAVSLIFLLIYMWPRLWAALGLKKMLTGAALLGVFCAVAMFLFPEEIRFGLDKVFHPKEDYHVITKMLSTEKGLEVTTVENDVIYVVLTENEESPFVVRNEKGTEIRLVKNKEKNYYTLADKRFSNFRLYSEDVVSNGQWYPGVQIFNPTINKKWTLALVDGEYMIYNKFKKLDELREIPAWGFEDCQHFGDKRGYIWSRTIPLLKNYMLYGSGPNTFTEVFPNDDYVGKTNMNYDGVMVTKPHNMYLQIWVQTGFMSLLAFLLLFVLYFVKSVKLYFNRPLDSVLDKLGLALMVGLFGYMVAGLANDSTVTVAPLYWGMMGLGLAVNRLVRAEREKKEETQHE